MKNLLPLLLCIFGLLSFTNTQRTPTTTTTAPPPTTTTPPTTTDPPTTTVPTTISTPQCILNFYGTPPAPACTPFTDTDGVQYDCAIQSGTPSSSSTLDKTTKALTVTTGSFYEMDFSGACSSCVLYLFNKPNFAGAYVVYPFMKAKFNMLLAYNVWKVPFSSFKVICNRL